MPKWWPHLQLDLSTCARADKVSDRIEDDRSFNECASCGALCPNRRLRPLTEIRDEYDVSPLRERLTKFHDALIRRLQWTRVDCDGNTSVEMGEDNVAASYAASSLTSLSASRMSI